MDHHARDTLAGVRHPHLTASTCWEAIASDLWSGSGSQPAEPLDLPAVKPRVDHWAPFVVAHHLPRMLPCFDPSCCYLDQMTALVVKPAPRTPADARAVARRTLKDLDRRLAAAAGSGTLNAYMSAHVEESRARVKKALDAGLEAER